MNLSKSLEDYLESIYLIMLEDDVVRLKKIAQKMNVKAPSALGAVKNLKKEGLVIHEKYGSIKLTESGEKIARNIFQKHRIIFTFLNEILGIDFETSQDEACKLEHHLSDETTDRFVKFISYLKSCPKCETDGFERFHKYYEENSSSLNSFEKISINTVDKMKEGQSGLILKINGKKNERKKLISLGVLPKMKITVSSIKNDDITIDFEDYNIVLDKKLACNIQIEVKK